MISFKKIFKLIRLIESKFYLINNKKQIKTMLKNILNKLFNYDYMKIKIKQKK